ncbi:hypothetical protein EV426DRAFT_624629, partial [Tirmania nivea]
MPMCWPRFMTCLTMVRLVDSRPCSASIDGKERNRRPWINLRIIHYKRLKQDDVLCSKASVMQKKRQLKLPSHSRLGEKKHLSSINIYLFLNLQCVLINVEAPHTLTCTVSSSFNLTKQD